MYGPLQGLKDSLFLFRVQGGGLRRDARQPLDIEESTTRSDGHWRMEAEELRTTNYKAEVSRRACCADLEWIFLLTSAHTVCFTGQRVMP